MPTIARIGPYRVYFYSHETTEPPHVHLDRDEKTAKFWLAPVLLARNLGFRANELRDLQRLVRENAADFLGSWHDFFGT